MLAKTDRNGLLKDLNTGLVLTHDKSSLEAAKAFKMKRIAETKYITEMENRIKTLEEIVSKLINK